MADNRYAFLGLIDNPFPRVPTVDPTSHDIRMTGAIYNEEIFRDQVVALRQRLERGENLIYAQNTKFVAGVGKSALIAREWRRLQNVSPETTIFVRCGRAIQASTIGGVCNAIVEALVRQGALWKALGGILKKYVQDVEKPVLDRGVVDNLVTVYAKPPRVLPARALMLWDVKAAVDSVATWLDEIAPRISRDVVIVFLASMLSEPGKFLEAYMKKVKRRELTGFITILELLRIGDVGYLYVFLDQFEELFHGRGKKEVHDLMSSMRQILEASPSLATFVVTLHPSAAMELRSADGQSLTTVAPVNDRHVVDLPNITPGQAVRLAQTYLERFRKFGDDGRTSSAPFSDDCIELISDSYDGNIRQILQTLHYCIDAAVEHGVEHIGQDFFHQHYREITGKVSDQDVELR